LIEIDKNVQRQLNHQATILHPPTTQRCTRKRILDSLRAEATALLKTR